MENKKTEGINSIFDNLRRQTILAEHKPVTPDKNRLHFHLMPPVGWLNDPNGLCQFNGIYHVFFQYSPLDANGGMKAWGHYTSKDFIHWDYQGVPFFPDEKFDKDGVYSGSAFIHQGTMYLYYTGNVKQPGNFDYINAGREANTIVITSEDGFTFSPKKCIMTNKDYPDTYTCHIRDPKVWKQDETFYMIQGGRKKGVTKDQGGVLLFASKDLLHWNFCSEQTLPDYFGYMWECPDFFSLPANAWSGKEEQISILSLSPQGLESETYRFQNIYQSGYFQVLGDIAGDCELVDFEEWDYGFDFYAPQTFEDEKGRRILIGWAGIPDADYDNAPTVKTGWQHALTLPRQLTWRGGKVYQKPVEEIKKIRKNQRCVSDGESVSVTTADVEISDIDSADLLVKFDQEGSGFLLHYGEGVFELEFYGEKAEEIGRKRTKRQLFLDGLQKVRILLDTSLVEIYLNEGEKVLTSRYFVDEGDFTMEVHCEGSKNTIWKMDCFEIR